MITNQSESTCLSLAQRRQWDEEGYLLLRGAAAPEMIRRTRRALARVVDAMMAQLYMEKRIPSEYEDLPLETRLAKAGKEAGRFGRSWRRGVASPEIFELHHAPAVLDAIEYICDTPGTVIGHPVFNARPKLPGQQLTVVPWHQDSSYFGKESATCKIITVWIPLVPVDADSGCLQVIPGSNKAGLFEHRKEEREGGFLEMDVSPEDQARAVTCPMQPGDVLMFDNLTMHRSLPTTADTIRWSVDVRYIRESDHVGNVGWADPDFKWVLRSDKEPVTTYDQWLNVVRQWRW